MVGEKVLHYEIRKQLGRGGMGVVYKARDTRLDRWVALKFLPQHASDDPLARERFVREAKAASALEHPHICTIHEIGETEDGQLYICMAYYDGPNLRKAISSGEIGLQRGFEMGRQLCHALARAHDAGIVHRDLKPSNIMTTKQGDVAIVDFGLAKLAGEISLTKTGATLGTTAYMSPEQVRGEELDYRTDLWSLGVIIYQLITGKYPFQGDYDGAIRRAIMEDDPPPPSSIQPELPPHVDGFMGRVLAKDRNSRFASAAEIEQVLLSLSRSEDSELPTQLQVPHSSSTSTSKIGGKSIPWRKLAIGAVIAAALFAAWCFVPPPPPSTPPIEPQSLAVMPFENFTGDQSKNYVSEGMASSLITALGQLQGLTVLSRSEAWAFRNRDWTASRLGEELGVQTLLEGEVQGKTDAISVSTRLIDVPTGGVVWSEEVVGTTERLPDLTREIARRLTDVLEIHVSEKERLQLEQDPTRSFQAYDYYLQGQEFLSDRYAPENLDSALELFRQAIRVDLEFALAHVALSETYWEIWYRDGDATALAEAKAEAETALELDPELPAALVAKARVQRSGGRYTDSISSLEDALSQHPDPAAAHRELALSYERAGDLESAEQALRAATLVGDEDWKNWNLLGAFLWRMGKYGQAREAFESSIELTPEGTYVPNRNLGGNEISLGNWEAAIVVLEQIPETDLSASWASNLGTAYYFSQRPDKWDKVNRYFEMATRIEPRSDQIRRNLADLYLEQGKTDLARAQYLEALRLVDEKIEGDSGDWNLRLLRCFYSARAGMCTQALNDLDELSSDLPQTGLTAQRSAYVFALCDRIDQALEAIREAIELGVQPELLRAEPEFEALRDDARFQSLTGSAN